MRSVIILLILSITLQGKDSINIYYAQKRSNSTEVKIPLDNFADQKKEAIYKFYRNVKSKLNSGEELPLDGFKKHTTTSSNPHWNSDRYTLIGDQAKYFENITGFSTNSPLVVVLVSPNGSVKLDTIRFDSFELFFYVEAAGEGWEVTSKFRLPRSSDLFSQRSGRNKPLFAGNPSIFTQPIKSSDVEEVDIPEEVRIFHDENINFRTEYWKDNESYITKNTSYKKFIEKRGNRFIQKLCSIDVFSGTGYEPWFVSLCALPSYENYSHVVVLDKTGKVLVSDIPSIHGKISNCYGTIPLNTNHGVSEVIVYRVRAAYGNSYLVILKPTTNGSFDEIFSYWDVRD